MAEIKTIKNKIDKAYLLWDHVQELNAAVGISQATLDEISDKIIHCLNCYNKDIKNALKERDN